MTGKIGKTTIGLLNIQTRATNFISDDEQVNVSTTNFGVFRLKRDILFRYIFRPGSDFYLVYNEEQLIGANNNEIRNRTLMVKMIYFWRK